VLASGSLTVASGVHSAKSQTSTYTTDLLSAQTSQSSVIILFSGA